MANGKPGDSPITDLLHYGGHPYPPDMEQMIRRLNTLQPGRLPELGLEPFDWERGINLEEGRAWLRQALRRAGDPEPPPAVSWLVGRWWNLRFAMRRFSRGRLRQWLGPLLRRTARTGPPPASR